MIAQYFHEEHKLCGILVYKKEKYTNKVTLFGELDDVFCS